MIEFASVVYHTLLTGQQSDNLEALQKRALKIATSSRADYEETLAATGVDSLRERTEKAFLKFAIKASENSYVCDKWFPKKY